MEVNATKCSICSRQYKTYDSLRRHAKQKHEHAVENLAPLKRRKYDCCECGKQYNKKEFLSKHERKVHNIEYVRYNTKVHKCPSCSYKHYQRNNVISHISECCQLNLDPIMLEFSSEDDFYIWKKEEERNKKFRFVSIGGKHKNLQSKSQTFICNRSGNYQTKMERLRTLKTQGSCKLNSVCPATIKYKEENGIYKVKYIINHIHEVELGHIRLLKEDRCLIANKIAAGIPFNVILDQVRQSVYDGDLDRLHLLTKKDIHNIEDSFNLCGSIKRHQNDAVSVDAWIQQDMLLSGPSVLFYKPQETTSPDFPELNPEDFALVIMNDAQAETLKKFGSDTICIDGTHGLNQYNFELISLLVLDDLRQGFPCAFLISNRTDVIILKIFFEKIKERVGEICPKNFMSDMAEAFFNAFMLVMPSREVNRLFCSWHVDRAWRKNLTKIKSNLKKVEVYKLLRTLLEETDIKTFAGIFEDAVRYLNDSEDTKDFCNYFCNTYKGNVKSWAYCYRLHCGINTNMHLERMHRTIKYIYCHNKKGKRLDNMIHVLQTFIRDRLYDRLISLHKGKVTSKITALRKRHLASLELDVNALIQQEDGWICHSSSCSEIYIIQTGSTECNNCQIRCLDCLHCIHSFTCTCADNSIQWNMCKHIHLLCRKILADKSPLTDSTILHHLDNNKIEESKIVSQISQSKVNEGEKEDVEIRFKQLLEQADCDQLVVIKKHLLLLETTLSSMKSQTLNNLYNDHNVEKQIKKEPANKKLSPQRRLFGTRKKRPIASDTIQKPSHKEKEQIALHLLLK